MVTFLLVDDLEENLLALEALLKRDGLRCIKARSGDEALEVLLKEDIALALLDVQMPGMDGFQLAEFMRGAERAKHVPIIFLTAGTADVQRRFRGYEAGAVDFIQKPIEADILRSKANVFFDLHRQRQQILAQRDELEAYAKTLKAVDQRRNVFIAVLGHELRNPVMALTAGLSLLRQSGDPRRAEEIRERMERQLRHLSRLTDDLVDIARIDQGKISLRKETIDLGEVLRAAVETSEGHIAAGGHTLTITPPEGPVLISADSTRLAQVISNLLNNAAKYTPPGGRIGVSVNTLEDAVEIAVTDNGIGIPLAMQTQIFEIFSQIPGAGNRAQEGLGIGLALVKQLVDLHGGAITVESPGENAGSTFKVRLPLRTTTPAPPEVLAVR